MQIAKTAKFQSDFDAWQKRVLKGETVIIEQEKNQNIVMLSQKKYDELLKESRNARYLSMIDNSIKQAAFGKVVTKTFSELENYE